MCSSRDQEVRVDAWSDLGVVDLSLLGGFALRCGGREIDGLPRKTRALLAFLAAQGGRSVSREAVADLIWTDRGAEQANHSLRQALLVLRRTLAGGERGIVQSGEGVLAFDPATAICDLVLFETICGSERRAELEDVVRLYKGPLLAELPTVSPGFDTWLSTARDRIEAAALAAMGRLADLLMASGETDRAAQVAERMVALDPVREDLHRRLMTIYARAGRRSEALRQYDTCVQTLRRELDVSPSAETRELVRRLRAQESDAQRDDTPAAETMATVAATAASRPPWIAILPFRSFTPDTLPAYFAEGLTEDITFALTALRDPVVISYGSTLAYREARADPRDVGRTLGVQYVVQGTMRCVGRNLRVGVELASAEDGTVLWAQPFTCQKPAGEPNGCAMLFEALERIAGEIVAMAATRLHAWEMQRLRCKPPGNLGAYDLVLQARHLMYGLKKTDFARAEKLLREALALDPGYATALVLAAEWHSLRIGQGWSENAAADAESVDRFACAAIAQDRTNARALAFRGHNQAYLYRDYDGALALFDRALEAGPNNAAAWVWSSPTLSYIGDGKAAIERAERGLRLSPQDPFAFQSYAALCVAHYTENSYEEAARWGRLAMSENPHYTSNLRFTAASLAALGQRTEARGLARQILAVQPDFRVRTLIDRHPYRDAERRLRLGRHLVEAGLPA
jgi:DNA-binding SARP family transcriptional activator